MLFLAETSFNKRKMPQNRRQIFVPGTLSEKQSDNILLFTAYVTFFHVFQPTNNFRFKIKKNVMKGFQYRIKSVNPA